MQYNAIALHYFACSCKNTTVQRSEARYYLTGIYLQQFPGGEVKAGDHNESIHMEDHISSHTAAAPCVGLNVTVEDIIQVLQRFMCEHSSTTNNTTSPYAILLKSLRDYHYPPNTLLVVVLLQIIRKLFSEAQVLKYIILYYVCLLYTSDAADE